MNRQRIRAALRTSPRASLFVARLYAFASAVAALRWRLRAWPRASIGRSVKVIGWRELALGRNVVVGAYSWLNVNHRGRGIAITLGDNTYIGNENFFSTGRSIRIGDYTLTASRCSFIGSSHHHDDPMIPYATTGTTDDAIIDIGVNCFLGFGATVMGNVRVGHGSVIGAHSVVRSDVPPFCVAVGVPARVIRHYDFAASAWVDGAPPADAAPMPEADYLAALRSHAGFSVQPISAAAATFGDI